MTGSIICGVDGSESAKGAARVARGLSAQLGSRLVFVRVVEDASPDREISVAAARLQQLAECATDVDCGAQWLVEVGHPADRLVAVAEKEAASLIVVGSTGPRSSLLGSISADVSRRAPCPVVVVAPGADRSLAYGNGKGRISGRTGFPGLFDDGYTGGFDAAWAPSAANGDPVGDDPGARDFAGGIVRFSIDGGSWRPERGRR
jgi:nucleotide-binding universal stress UspA family protein